MVSEIRNNIGVCTLDLADTIVRPRMGESSDPLLRVHVYTFISQMNKITKAKDALTTCTHTCIFSEVIRFVPAK